MIPSRGQAVMIRKPIELPPASTASITQLNAARPRTTDGGGRLCGAVLVQRRVHPAA
jgi:hypothetical protein